VELSRSSPQLINLQTFLRHRVVFVVVLVGIMTVKLLPAFLQCFDDEFAAVRAEACIAASRLRIHDEQVICKVSNLIRDDAIHRVKALAIQGLSVGSYENKTFYWIRPSTRVGMDTRRWQEEDRITKEDMARHT